MSFNAAKGATALPVPSGAWASGLGLRVISSVVMIAAGGVRSSAPELAAVRSSVAAGWIGAWAARPRQVVWAWVKVTTGG